MDVQSVQIIKFVQNVDPCTSSLFKIRVNNVLILVKHVIPRVHV